MRNSILTIILSICSLYAWAQNTGESGVNPVGSLQVDISRVISVQNAKKLSVPIQIEKIRVADPSYDYPIFPKLFAVNPYYSEPIQPITLGEVKMPQLLKNYAVAGFGNYRNALADFYFSSNRDRSKVYDIAFNHRSGKAPSRYSGFGTTNLKANMERLYQKHQLNLSLNGYYKTLHHYGFFSDSIPDSININADSIKTNYGNVDLQLRYNNFRSNTEKHKYEAWLLPYYFRSNHGETEWAAVGGAHLIENLNKTSLLNFEVQYDYNTYYVASGNWLRNIVRVGANYEIKKDALQARIGFKTASDNTQPPGDATPSENNIHFYPDAAVRYGLADNMLVLYANVGGGLQKNSLKSISEKNPFVSSNINLRNTSERINVNGGIKGTLTRELNYHLYAGYRNMDNMLLYVNVDSTLNYFKPIYTGSNAGIFQTGAELLYRQNERLMLSAKGNYYQYWFVNNQAWNLPTFDLKISGQYNFQDKIITYAEVFAMNKRTGGDDALPKANTFAMKGAVDISLGVDYQFNSKTYFFLKLNNLLNQKYMVWNGYRVQGFHVLAGLKIAF